MATTSTKRRKCISALEIYNAYPAAVLLRVSPPLPGESARKYYRRLDGRYGDALFEFILHAAAETQFDRRRCLELLDGVVTDLMLMTSKLSSKLPT